MNKLLQLLSVAEARSRILESFRPLDTETVHLEDSARRVLAEAVIAPHDLPRFDNSSMDGYAVRQGEVADARPERPVTLPVSADIPAGGAMPAPLRVGTVARIMTGAPLPPGADAVVPVEDTDTGLDRDKARDHFGGAVPAEVSILKAPALRASIRQAGQDVRAGQVVVAPGAVLGPASMGVLAALGHSHLTVYRQPRAVVFSTGDELCPVDEEPGPGQIRDVNSLSLSVAAAQYGAQVVRLGVARDNFDAVRARLLEAVEQKADVILSSAGVSVGAYDVVKAAVEAEGSLRFWRVRMRPGKPLAFGQVRGVPFFGLPGNPVSALMAFEVFVRPALLKLGGHRAWDKIEIRAALTEPLRSDGRESYLRVIVSRQGDGYVARAAGDQGSAVLSSLVRANGLLILPEGVTEARPGDVFPVWLLEAAETGLGPAGEG